MVILTYLSIIILSIIKEWFPHQDFEENGSMENVHSNKKYAFEKNMKKKCIEKIKNMKNKICIRNKKMRSKQKMHSKKKMHSNKKYANVTALIIKV